jgi:hypothetical protein
MLDYQPEELKQQLDTLIANQQFPASGITQAGTIFFARSITLLQERLTSYNVEQIMAMNWGIATETAGQARANLFRGDLQPGTLANDFVQETLIKLPYYRVDVVDVTYGVGIFSILDFWAKCGDILGMMGYTDGVPVCLSGMFYYDYRSDKLLSTQTDSINQSLKLTEDQCGGMLKLLAVAYPEGHYPIRLTLYGQVVGSQELRYQEGASGSEYRLKFKDQTIVSCNGGLFLQGFLSLARWLMLTPSTYLKRIERADGQRCVITRE